MGGGLRGDRPEQRLLAAQDAEVGDVITAVGDGDGEVAHDNAGVVGAAALSGWPHRPRERLREPEAVGQLDQEIGPGVGDEPLAVRPDFYGLRRRLCLHLPGVLLGLWEWARKPHSQEPGGRSRRVSSGAYRWIRARCGVSIIQCRWAMDCLFAGAAKWGSRDPACPILRRAGSYLGRSGSQGAPK